ncbi:unnamed protein product [Ixodes hexagonus]
MPQVRARGFPWLAEDTLLTLVEPPSQELSCCSCGDLVGTLWGAPCQHRFCTRCLEPLLGQDSRAPCPIDTSEILRAQLLADNSVQAQASQLRAHCPNGGCMATPPLINLEASHTRQCVETAPSALPSDNAPMTPEVSSGAQEVSGDCWMANLGCSFTGMPPELESHEADWELHRRLVVTRLAEYRRNLEDIQGERDLLRNQLNEANASLKNLRLDLNQQRVETTARMIARDFMVQARSDKLERQLRDTEQRLSRLEGTALPQTQPQQPASYLPGLQQPIGGGQLYPELQGSLCAAVNMPSAPDASLASLASLAPSVVGNDQELVCQDGVLNWRLSDYGRAKRKERHGQHRYTAGPRFYTAEPGYLMQLRVHLHGLGHKGKFVAVQLVLHRGRHDNQLPWPFRHRVTVTLVDQTGGGRSVGYTIHDPCFPRPQGDHTTPYAWQEFVSLKDLEEKFLFQESLLFRVVVEP